MRQAIIFFLLASPVLAQNIAPLDVVHLHNGSVLRGRVTRLATQTIAMQVILPGIAASASRDIATQDVRFIDFAPLPGEAEALASPADPAQQQRLLELWQEKSVNLRWPTNNAGTIGLAYAAALMKQTNPALVERALRIHQLIEKEDWDSARRNEARKGGLRCLIALRRLDEAIRAAQHLAQSTEDASLLIEARLVLARADFEKLKAFDKEHPRWSDDDDLKAERTRRVHEVHDQLLHPSLFHGSQEALAAEALEALVQVCHYLGDKAEAAQKARDLIELYPHTPQAARARSGIRQDSETPHQPSPRSGIHQDSAAPANY